MRAQKRMAFIGPKLSLIFEYTRSKKRKKNGFYRGQTELYATVHADQSASKKTAFIGPKLVLFTKYTRSKMRPYMGPIITPIPNDY